MRAIYNFLTALNKIITKLEEIFLIIATPLIVFPLVIAIISRYIFGNPMGWANELALLLFLYIAFIGASLAFKNDSQFAVRFLYNSLSPKYKKVVDIISDLLMITFASLIIFSTFRAFPRQIHRQFAAWLDVNKAWHTFALTSGMTFVLIFKINHLIEVIFIDKEEN